MKYCLANCPYIYLQLTSIYSGQYALVFQDSDATQTEAFATLQLVKLLHQTIIFPCFDWLSLSFEIRQFTSPYKS